MDLQNSNQTDDESCLAAYPTGRRGTAQRWKRSMNLQNSNQTDDESCLAAYPAGRRGTALAVEEVHELAGNDELRYDFISEFLIKSWNADMG
ncbi:hypothetical protein DWZ54_05430 [Mitsuokella sp. AF33-22]|nr:hypothetical protein DWZ54_05430 [Mitsuokella sp. AF33-22]